MLHLSPLICIYVLVLAAVLGLVMGSFLNCLAYRLVHGGSVLKGRSRCALCGHTLSGRDLVPVFSWLFLKGRCRYCGERISARYIVSELVCAAAFVSVTARFDVTLVCLQYLILVCILFTLSVVDWDSSLIPDSMIVAAAVVWAVFLPWTADPLQGLIFSLIGAFAITVPLFLLVLLADKLMKKETMGGGDLKLIFVLGLYFGWMANLMLLIIGCIVGLIIALVTKKAPKQAFPFGPSLAIAAWIVMLSGDKLISWYMGLF